MWQARIVGYGVPFYTVKTHFLVPLVRESVDTLFLTALAGALVFERETMIYLRHLMYI